MSLEIKFDPIKHVYTNIYTNEEYTSVTRFLSKFKPKFDEVTFATQVSLREGCSVQDILTRWKEENEKSKLYGTNIHQILEKFMNEGVYEPENTTLCKAFKKVFSLRKKDGIEVEKKLFSHINKIAGTADIIVSENKYFDIYDIKTNKKFNIYSKYNEYLSSPLEYLPYSEYTLYSLQTSLYAYMYANMTGREFRQSAILYWDRDEEQFIKIPTFYLKSQIIELLNYVDR